MIRIIKITISPALILPKIINRPQIFSQADVPSFSSEASSKRFVIDPPCIVAVCPIIPLAIICKKPFCWEHDVVFEILEVCLSIDSAGGK